MALKKGTYLVSNTSKSKIYKISAETVNGYLVESADSPWYGPQIYFSFEQIRKVFFKLNKKTGELTSLLK